MTGAVITLPSITSQILKLYFSNVFEQLKNLLSEQMFRQICYGVLASFSQCKLEKWPENSSL